MAAEDGSNTDSTGAENDNQSNQDANSQDTAAPAAPDPDAFGPTTVTSTQEVSTEVVSDWASRHAPPQDAAVRSGVVQGAALGLSAQEQNTLGMENWSAMMKGYGLDPTEEARAKAQNLADIQTAPLSAKEALPARDAVLASRMEQAKSALADMPVGQRYNREGDVMAQVDQSMKSFDRFAADVQRGVDMSSIGSLVPTKENVPGSLDPTLDKMLSGPFGKQAGEIAGLLTAGVTPDKINDLAAPSVQDIIGTVLSAAVSPVTALPDIAMKTIGMTAPNVMDRYAMDKMTNPLGAFGPLGKVADVALSALGPFAAPAKMAASAVGLAMSPSVSNFAKGPSEPSFSSHPSGDSGTLDQIMEQLWQPKPGQQKTEQDSLLNLLPKI